ncbi:hypothetical protein [Coralloluteibacterium thermophilus]|uniref:Uncharacterized protein n=1 Tax=Coralloluteibacterium thermophilum TaxID=2707049 RepID=A0ABV9NMC4_9GAMM
MSKRPHPDPLPPRAQARVDREGRTASMGKLAARLLGWMLLIVLGLVAAVALLVR